jgi:hypothetical protein
MHGKRLWLRPGFLFLALPAAGLFVWGMLGGGLTSGPPGSAALRDPTRATPASLAASVNPPADSGRWCDVGLGCNDGQ